MKSGGCQRLENVGVESDLQIFGVAEVQDLAEQGYTVIPLIEKLPQTETAGALYERFRGNGPSFLLESAESERPSRYSFIGTDPDMVVQLEAAGMMVNGKRQEFDNPYDFVDELINGRNVAPVADLPPFFGGAVGFFGYDLARYHEPSIGPAKPDKLGLPEMALMIPGTTVVVDHYQQSVSIIKNLLLDPNTDEQALATAHQAATESIRAIKQRIIDPSLTARPPQSLQPKLAFSSNMTPEAFQAGVELAKEYIKAGDVFQVVPSQRFSSDRPVNKDFAHQAYQQLRQLNPSRYMFLLEFDEFQVAGCSPETLVSVRDRHLKHMAIAGTRKRGRTAAEDAQLAQELLGDQKERAEHAMLVDLSRSDVSQVCEPGSVQVTSHTEVVNHSHVMHLTSEIYGKLLEGQTALDALRRILPAGTLSGAPKIRAMQIIDELEPDKRGPYGGAVGYLTFAGDLDACICIRSLVADNAGLVHVQAGAGVVADSVAASEFAETVAKAGAPLQAVERVCNPAVPKQRLEAVAKQPTPRKHRAAGRIGPKVLLLDNFDSFTYNLVHALSIAGADVEVLRSDVAMRELTNVKPDFFVVSPGPKGPKDAGRSIEALRHFSEKGVPSLGVCLGHQALVAAFGGQIVRHEPAHGKTANIIHDGQTIFQGLPKPLKVMRYHSLIAASSLPAVLERSAYVDEDDQKLIMAVRHREQPLEGMQFHPESYYTESGLKLIRNFLRRAGAAVDANVVSASGGV